MRMHSPAYASHLRWHLPNMAASRGQRKWGQCVNDETHILFYSTRDAAAAGGVPFYRKFTAVIHGAVYGFDLEELR